MLEIFESEYLVVLKSFNQLESLINFLSKEAGQQMIKPDEPLVSVNLLSMLANEVLMTATHTNRSAGQYSKFLLYIEEDEKNAAFLQRSTDDENAPEFLNLDIVLTVNDEGRSSSLCDDKHMLTN
jgi:hypothetical protein